jgi:hypothetical protein
LRRRAGSGSGKKVRRWGMEAERDGIDDVKRRENRSAKTGVVNGGGSGKGASRSWVHANAAHTKTNPTASVDGIPKKRG